MLQHDITNTPTSTPEASLPPSPFITLDEAGRLAGGLTARWVADHLRHHFASGAPRIISMPANGASARSVVKLVDRELWIEWIRSHADESPLERTRFVPVELLSPGQRRQHLSHSQRKGR